jgi:hypothetical protein
MDVKTHLNRIGIFSACGDKDFDIIDLPPRAVVANGIIKSVTPHRLKKDYSVGKGKSAIKFSAFVYTDIDVETAKPQIDAAVESISDDDAKKYLTSPNNMSFSWTDKYIGGK